MKFALENSAEAHDKVDLEVWNQNHALNERVVLILEKIRVKTCLNKHCIRQVEYYLKRIMGFIFVYIKMQSDWNSRFNPTAYTIRGSRQLWHRVEWNCKTYQHKLCFREPCHCRWANYVWDHTAYIWCSCTEKIQCFCYALRNHFNGGRLNYDTIL